MIELRALGTLELRNEDGAAVDAVLSQPKRAAILVYLAAAGRGDYLRRDPLLALFWPEQTETKARGSLRQALYALKQDLGGEMIATRGDDEVGLNTDVLWCDVRAFDEALSAGELERAVELYRGPFLSGFFLKGNAEFDQWVEGERDRLLRECGQALETLAEQAIERGDVPQAVEWLRRLATHSPYSTRVALKYMEALAAAGDRAGALKYAERLSERVEEDLGAAPSPDVVSYAEQLRKEPAAHHETRFIRIKNRAPKGGIDALRSALLDRYTIERELGSGGMATVYLAEDAKHHRKVAIKVLKPELAAAIGPERFLREIEIIAQLNHPHVLPVHDSGEAGQFLYYVMPYVDGESVRDRLRRETQLPIDDAVAIAGQVANALDYAHRKQIVHRDIKPENILLQDGQALVADFGIALAVQAVGDTRLTETGLSIGTPQYMSPEQAAGDRALDGRSDIYSLGCVLYEMLAGEPPHTGPTTQAILAKIATDEPRDISELRKTVPEHIAWAARTALAKLPADRFATAARFGEMVAGAEIGAPVGVTPARPRVAGVINIPKWLMVAFAAVAGVLIVAAVWGWTRDPQAGLRVSRWVVPTKHPGVLSSWYTPVFGARIAIAPDGSRLAYVGGEGSSRRLYTRALDETQAAAIPGTDYAYSPFFSPDGRWIAFATRGALKKVRLPAGPITTIGEFNLGVRGGTWGTNDTIILGGTRGGLVRLPASGGSIDYIVQAADVSDSAFYDWPHFWRSANAILFTKRYGFGIDSVWAASLESGHQRLLVGGSYPQLTPTGHLVYAQSEGTLAAVALDQRQLAVIDNPVPVLGGIDQRANFALTHDGTLAYVPAQPTSERVVVVDRQGRPVSSWNQRGQFLSPRLSHDGTRIAASFNIPEPTRQTASIVHLWIHTSGEAPQRFASQTSQYYPVWSPLSDRIAFTEGFEDGIGGSRIASIAADGPGAVEVLLSNDSTNYFITDWSRDGRFVAFFSYRSGVTRQDLGFLTLPSSGSPQTFLRTEAAEFAGRFSPDGRYLAYVSSETGRDEVYVRPFPDAQAGFWQVSREGGTEPIWSKDGHELFYWSEDRFMAVPVETEGGFRSGEQDILFTGPQYKRFYANGQYDVYPTGDRFVMIEVGETDIAVVLNWTEELKELLTEATQPVGNK